MLRDGSKRRGLGQHGRGFAAAAGAGYAASAVEFDGTNDYMLRGSDYTGNADGKQGIVSVWMKRASDGANHYISYGAAGRFSCIISAANKMDLAAASTIGVSSMRVFSTTDIVTADGWVHLLASWDVSISAIHFYLSDVEDANITKNLDNTLDYTQTDYAIGASTAGAVKFDGCLSDIYINTAEYIDLSVLANRRKFIDANGKPVDLGSDGSTPTGTAPIVFLNGDLTDFQTNAGTGGNLTVTGALAACSNSPSD